MEKKRKRDLYAAIGLLAAFALWTAGVGLVDVRPIGPGGSQVGFGAVNSFFHGLTGVHMWLYTLTDWLGLVPVAVALGFGVLGLAQWIGRKGFLRVDKSLLVLGGFYILTAAAYLFFEEVVINYRPVLIEGRLEASYPSSTTLLVLCVMPAAAMQLHRRIKNRSLNNLILWMAGIFTAFMVLGRLLSGVHWLTDVIGGVLLGCGLLLLYRAALSLVSK